MIQFLRDLLLIPALWRRAVEPAVPMKLLAHVLKTLGDASKKSSVIYWFDLRLTRRIEDFGEAA